MYLHALLASDLHKPEDLEAIYLMLMKQSRGFGSSIVGTYFRLFVLHQAHRNGVVSLRPLTKTAINDMLDAPENEIVLPAVKWIVEHCIATTAGSAVATLWPKIDKKQHQTVAYGFACAIEDVSFLAIILSESTIFATESSIQQRTAITLLKQRASSTLPSNHDADLKLLKFAYSIARKISTPADISISILAALVPFVSNQMPNLKNLEVIFTEVAYRTDFISNADTLRLVQAVCSDKKAPEIFELGSFIKFIEMTLNKRTQKLASQLILDRLLTIKEMTKSLFSLLILSLLNLDEVEDEIFLKIVSFAKSIDSDPENTLERLIAIRTTLNYNSIHQLDQLAILTVELVNCDSPMATKYSYVTFAWLTISSTSKSVDQLVQKSLELDCIDHSVQIRSLNGLKLNESILI